MLPFCKLISTHGNPPGQILHVATFSTLLILLFSMAMANMARHFGQVDNTVSVPQESFDAEMAARLEANPTRSSSIRFFHTFSPIFTLFRHISTAWLAWHPCSAMFWRLAKLWSKQRRVESCLRPCKQLLLRPPRWGRPGKNQNLYCLIGFYQTISDSQNCTWLHLDAFGIIWHHMARFDSSFWTYFLSESPSPSFFAP